MTAVRRLNRPVAVAALLAGVDAGSLAEADVFAAELLDIASRRRLRPKRRARVLTELMQRWRSLGPQARRSVGAAAGADLAAILARDEAAAGAVVASLIPGGVLRETLQDERLSQQALQSAIASILRTLVGEPTNELAAAARSKLDVLAGAVLAGDPGFDDLDAAIARACRDFAEHRDDGPIAAALRCAHRPGPGLRLWLNASSEPGHLALRRLAKSLPIETFDARAADWLACGSLAGCVLSRAIEAGGLRALPVTLTRWHLLHDPRRRTHLRRAGRARALLADHSDDQLDESARLGLIAWSLALPGKPEERLAPALDSLTDASPRVRAAAVRAIASHAPPQPRDAALTDFCFDADPNVAHAAALRLCLPAGLHRIAARAPILATLTRSAHPRVRTLATDALNRADALAWPVGEQGAWHCPALARRLAAQSPETFLDNLRSAIASSDQNEAAATLRLAKRLGLASRLTPELTRLIASEQADERTLAAALGSIDLGAAGETASDADALRSRIGALASGHPDGRVRAEALACLCRGDAGRVRIDAYLEDPVPRVRANAAVACLRRDHDPSGPSRTLGLVALDTMLADPRPAHRRSALWAVERTGEHRLLGAIAGCAEREPDEALRIRAERTRDRLERLREFKPLHKNGTPALKLVGRCA